MRKFYKRLKKIIFRFVLFIIIAITLAFVVTHFTTTATNNRTWNEDQAILPYAEVKGDLATIHNIRNFTYASTSSYTPDYYDKTFDVSKLKKVWFIVEPFSGIPGSAHTFLSFEFEGDQFVSISVEIRKEKGELYSPIKGLFNQYELMYVIGDERDLVKLRSNYRKDEVYVYPVKTTVEKARRLFLGMLERANDLKENPEFYNTITNTCTTNIVKHVNTITPRRVPFLNLRVLLPENSDALAYEVGLIDTELPFLEAREYFHINDRAKKYADDPAFSVKIRQEK